MSSNRTHRNYSLFCNKAFDSIRVALTPCTSSTIRSYGWLFIGDVVPAVQIYELNELDKCKYVFLDLSFEYAKEVFPRILPKHRKNLFRRF